MTKIEKTDDKKATANLITVAYMNKFQLRKITVQR